MIEDDHMGINEPVGSIAELWRFPVKSMGGEELVRADVTESCLNETVVS